LDFNLNEDQGAIIEAVGALLEQYAGAERAIALAPKGQYDAKLDGALRESGFLEVARGEETGPLEAALVVEAVARSAGVVAVGAAALVAPGVAEGELDGPIAVATADHRGPIRYAANCRTLLVLDGDVARVVPVEPGDSEPVASNFGYPMGSAPAALARGGDSLGPGSGERLRSWWRLALAAEAVGTMGAALDYTVGYLKQRRQFGRPIGSFQAVQHRLANCTIALEGSRWLTYEAADKGAPAEMAATASAYAMQAASHLFAETHQLSGAIGFTREHDLHVWSMRLPALKLEMGGVPGHRRGVAELRWGKRR